MKVYFGTLLCVLGAAACSTNKPAEGAYDSTQVATTDTSDSTLTPASSEGSADHASDQSVSSSQPGSATNGTSSTGAGTGTTGSGAHSGAHSANTGATSTDNTHHNSGTGAGATGAAASTTTGTPAPAAPAAADNTKVNKRDADKAALTPGDQQENATDLKLTQQIRQAVMADGSLSFTAKNVKIITVNGKVTLRGPVNNAQERSAIEAAARKIAGADKVDNQLEVKK